MSPPPPSQRLLFPFALRKWTRLTLVEAVSQSRMGEAAAAAAAAAGPLALAPPVLDENAPDLYIPLMAFITFVLITGLVKGMLNAFHPDVLVAACSSMLALHALEDRKHDGVVVLVGAASGRGLPGAALLGGRGGGWAGGGGACRHRAAARASLVVGCQYSGSRWISRVQRLGW